MAKPILTLTTDFGLSDHYTGAMKGVILGICPDAQIVDISHQAGAYAIGEGAYLISQAYPCFPRGTAHVVVVDPGVGSARRPVLAEAGGQYFVAPDNGVLSMIFAREKHKVRVLSNPRYFREPVSQTFHGRDIFAPVAAHLLAGVPAAKLGPRIEDYTCLEFLKPQRNNRGVWEGSILHADRFGNLVTNFHVDEFPELMNRPFTVTAGRRRTGTLAPAYAEGRAGKLFAIVGSGGYLELSVKQASALRLTGCQPGSRVVLAFR